MVLSSLFVVPSRRDAFLISAGLLSGFIVTFGIARYLSSKRLTQVKVRRRGRLKLYLNGSFRSASVLWALYELGLQKQCDVIQEYPDPEDEAFHDDHEGVDKNQSLSDRGDSSREHSRRQPILELPDGHLMYRADAICFYLAEMHEKLLPYPENSHHYFHWSITAAETLDPLVHILLIEKYLTRESRKDRSLQRQASAKLSNAILDLNAHLSQRKYITSNRFTMADVIVGYSLLFVFFVNGGQFFVDAPYVREYLDRIMDRPRFKRSVGREEDWRQIVDLLDDHSESRVSSSSG